jgi:hypothetical protein
MLDFRARYEGDILYILILRSDELTLQCVRFEGLIPGP